MIVLYTFILTIYFHCVDPAISSWVSQFHQHAATRTEWVSFFRSKQRHEPILRYCLSIIGMPLPYFLSADQKKQRISYCTIIASSKQAFNKASPELLGLSTFPNATCRGSSLGFRRHWACFACGKKVSNRESGDKRLCLATFNFKWRKWMASVFLVFFFKNESKKPNEFELDLVE